MNATKSNPSRLESLRNFWNALPDCAGFKFFFDNPLSEVEGAERDIEQAKRELADATRRRDEAVDRLAKRVESAAAAEWSPEQIAQAKREGGAL